MSLKDWLAQFDCYGLREAKVTIGRATYDAVFYRQLMPGFTNLHGKEVEPYEVEAVLFVGKVPASWRRRKRTVYRFADDERDWYVASWADEKVANDPQYAEYHYEGKATFQLRPWALNDGSPIDRYESYDRVEARVLVTA